jgi:hypothetical protein
MTYNATSWNGMPVSFFSPFFALFFPGAVDAQYYEEKLVACEQALVEPMTA